MSRRKSYNDTSTGKADSQIRSLLCDTKSDAILKKMLLNIIKNDLTSRQKEIIMLYYFRGLDTSRIAEMCGISHQAVSAVMARARKRIYKVLQYYYGMEAADHEYSDI